MGQQGFSPSDFTAQSLTKGVPKMEERQKEELKAKGNRVLILNIIFFLVLFAGIFLVAYAGFLTAAIIIILAFIVSLLYIYFS
jgi:hypothetical protein